MRREATSSCSNVDSGCTRDYTSQFTATQTFKSKDELIKWAKEVGRSNNITVVVLRSDSGNVTRKARVTLGCERSGKGDSRRHTVTKKIGCPFRLKGKMLAAGDEWELIVAEGKHNHEAEDTIGKQLGHSFQGRLSQEDKSLVEDMYKTGKQPKEIGKALKERDKHNKSKPKTIYNACRSLKRVEEPKRLDSLEDRNSRLLKDRNFRLPGKYSFIEKHRTSPKKETVSDLLLTHPTSLELLLAFQTVLIIEHKVRVMRPGWAELRVRGVTSTNDTFPVALAFTSKHGDSYEWEWALSSLRGVMNDYRITMPDIVILDSESDEIQLAPMEGLDAINNVFPTAKVLLSRDTVYRFVASYTRMISELNHVERDSFIEEWKLLIASPTEADLERHVMQLHTKFDMSPKALEYVTETLLKPYKEMFVAAWTDKVMHFGIINLNFCSMSITLPFVLDFLSSVHVNQAVIDECWERLHGWIEYANATVKASLKESLENEYNDQDGFPELKKLHGTISIHALDMIGEETFAVKEIDDDFDDENCSCAIRSTHGLPCLHDIAKYIKEDQPIPLECINSYWRKLDLKPFSKTTESIVEGRFKRRRLSEEKTTTTDSVQALPDIMESELNSPNAGPSIVPSTQERQPDKEVYDIQSTKQLELVCPSVLRTYVLNVKDVPRDGHCGFRVIASLLGINDDDGWMRVRKDLLEELKFNEDHYAHLFGSKQKVDDLCHRLNYFQITCPEKQHWMTMPEMEIAIGFCDEHFVQVLFKENHMCTHPMPPPSALLTKREPSDFDRYQQQRSTEWATRYNARMKQFTSSLQPIVVSHENPIRSLGSRFDLSRDLVQPIEDSAQESAAESTSGLLNRIVTSRALRREQNQVAPTEVVELTQDDVTSLDTGENRRLPAVLLRRTQSHRVTLSSLSSALSPAERLVEAYFRTRPITGQEPPPPVDDRDSFSSIQAVINSESQVDTAVEIGLCRRPGSRFDLSCDLVQPTEDSAQESAAESINARIVTSRALRREQNQVAPTEVVESTQDVVTSLDTGENRWLQHLLIRRTQSHRVTLSSLSSALSSALSSERLVEAYFGIRPYTPPVPPPVDDRETLSEGHVDLWRWFSDPDPLPSF